MVPLLAKSFELSQGVLKTCRKNGSGNRAECSDIVVSVFLLLLILSPAVYCEDWPMWKHDAGRSAASPEELSNELHLQWKRELPKLEPAWPDEPRMTFGSFYEPVVMGKTMFIGSSHSDKLIALDTDTGKEKWVFYADGPIYFAPVAWENKVYFTSDDGYLYCIDAKKGSTIWKFRGGPRDRKIIGNSRLISSWPARGGPVLINGKIYFTASIWPFMGTFIHALDAKTGKVVWTNSGAGSIYTIQPHRGSAFAGVAPQGYLAANGDKLFIPNGRAVPAVLDRLTGKFLYFRLIENARSGGFRIAATKDYFINRFSVYNVGDGTKVKIRFKYNLDSILADNKIYIGNRGRLIVYDSGMNELSRLSSEGMTIHIKAGSRLYASGKSIIKAIDTPIQENKLVTSWETGVEGVPANIIVADKKLFVVTLEGSIYCFGADKISPYTHGVKKQKKPSSDQRPMQADEILKATGISEGYCVVLGIGTGHLIEDLAKKSRLHIIGIDPDKKKVGEIRRRLDAAGLYGRRVAVFCKDPVFSLEFPPYLANLIVSEDLKSSGFNKKGFIKSVFKTLRPYGGIACLPVGKEKQSAFITRVKAKKLANAEVKQAEGFILLSREGSLPGSADWTHQYADSGNTCVSKDEIVKAPLGLLWFGGLSNKKILPKHGMGPSEQVVNGRLFIEGPNIIRAVDVYTGRLLWEKSLPNVGMAYNTTDRQPGADGSGCNYVSVKDGVYVLYGNKCLRLNPAKGDTISEFVIPGRQEKPGDSSGYIAVWKEFLVITSYPIDFTKTEEHNKDIREKIAPWKNTCSKQIMVMNRYNGNILWKYDAKTYFRHASIAVGNGKVFCIDKPPNPGIEIESKDQKPELIALDIAKGNVIWSTTENVSGTVLCYSEEHDILLQAGRSTWYGLRDEAGKWMIAHKGKSGDLLWSKKNSSGGSIMLYGDSIIRQAKAYSLTNGKRATLEHPITGVKVSWRFSRSQGCGMVVASKNLITFRSAAAGYYDLENNSGTGNLGGFRAGCTSNLIVANGVLNAPDYTRLCSCSYHNQTSLALVHMPEAEMWTFNRFGLGENPIRRVGINFGAPGDRRAGNGTLWLDYPSVGGPSPSIPIKVIPGKPEWFRYHSSRIKNDGLKWVAASGVKGIESITIDLNTKGTIAYNVYLYFAEPGSLKKGERVFDVSMQGKKVLRNFDILEKNTNNEVVVKEFKNVIISKDLKLDFSPAGKSLICGIEILQEGK